jgi:hypothetical protein
MEATVTQLAQRVDEETTRDLVNDLMREGRNLVQEEIQLARTELKDEGRKAAMGTALVATGGAMLYGAYLIFAFGVVFLLAKVMDPWLAAFIVTAAFGILGVVLLVSGMNRLKGIDRPRHTLETLKEDGRWMRQIWQDARSTRRAAVSR